MIKRRNKCLTSKSYTKKNGKIWLATGVHHGRLEKNSRTVNNDHLRCVLICANIVGATNHLVADRALIFPVALIQKAAILEKAVCAGDYDDPD
jgi:hypothetical protein